MKVTFKKDYKAVFTVDDVERAKKVIKSEKEEDTETAATWAETAAREAVKGTNDFLEDVITANAVVAKNCRAWNAYFDGSYDMDVWIEALLKTANGYIEIGAYLSDIWQTGAVDYSNHMYIQRYKRQ